MMRSALRAWHGPSQSRDWLMSFPPVLDFESQVEASQGMIERVVDMVSCCQPCRAGKCGE